MPHLPRSSTPSRFYLRTYGCQMNERDSEAMRCLLEAAGYVSCDEEQEADILLYNTCSVRDQAEQKILGKLGLLKRLKRQNPRRIIGVLGCMAQRLGAALLTRFPHLDLVIGTDQFHSLPQLLQRIMTGERGLVAVSQEQAPEAYDVLGRHQPGKVSAYVAVMRGCNQFCTYCIVPEVRGREKSRPIPDIVAEVEALVRQDTREIFLLGQNITAYGMAEARHEAGLKAGDSPFADLLRAVCAVPGVRRVRFTSPHPKYMNAGFFQAVAELPQVCDAFHLPLQSGADRILQLMRRGYTLAEYLDRIRQFRKIRSQVTFSTDIIVGFPGETPEDFDATRRVMDEVGFDNAYIFKYSPRPGTRAGALPDDVPKAVKEERLKLLLDDLERRVLHGNRKYLGKTLEVLVEGPSSMNPERWTGRTSNSKVCLFPPLPETRAGDLLLVTVERVTSHSLFSTPAAAGPSSLSGFGVPPMPGMLLMAKPHKI